MPPSWQDTGSQLLTHHGWVRAKQLALHLWMFDMASSLRTQFMFGEPGDPNSQPCTTDPRPLSQRLEEVRLTRVVATSLKPQPPYNSSTCYPLVKEI